MPLEHQSIDVQTEVFDDANEDAPTVSHEDSELRVLGKNRYVRAPMFNSYVPLVHFDIYGYVRRLVGQKSKRTIRKIEDLWGDGWEDEPAEDRLN